MLEEWMDIQLWLGESFIIVKSVHENTSSLMLSGFGCNKISFCLFCRYSGEEFQSPMTTADLSLPLFRHVTVLSSVFWNSVVRYIHVWYCYAFVESCPILIPWHPSVSWEFLLTDVNVDISSMCYCSCIYIYHIFISIMYFCLASSI